MQCAGALAGALLLSAPFSGSAVLIKKDAPAFNELGDFSSLQRLEEVSLSKAVQEFRSLVNSSDASIASTTTGAFAEVKKQGSENMLFDYASSAQNMASNVTVDLETAIDHAQRSMKGASEASVKELARLGLATLEEKGARKELRRLAKSAAKLPCPFRYCPYAIQAGITRQGPFPFSSAMNGGYLIDFFLVLNGRSSILDGGALPEEKLCISLRIGGSDAYSGVFEKGTRSVFAGLASWESTMDKSNKWTWGVAGGPRRVVEGFQKILNFFSAEVSFPVIKRRFDLSLSSFKFDIDNLKVSYCFSDLDECSQALPDLQYYTMLFGEYTMCV